MNVGNAELLKQNVVAEFKLYNANTQNRSTSDCIIRALALAYSEDYDKVHRDLNAIKRKLGYSKYNISPVYEAYMQDQGHVTKDTPEGLDLFPDITVGEFADSIVSGTYILVCGKTYGTVDHAVVVIDGDIYDSWHSEGEYVKYVYIIDESPRQFVTSESIKEFIQEIADYGLDYLRKSNSRKSDYLEFGLQYVNSTGRYSEEVRYVCYADDKILDVIGEYPGKSRNFIAAKSFMVKFVPTISTEMNIERSKSKLKDQIREWSWSIRNTINTQLELDKLVINSKFRGHERLLLKIPEKYRSHMLMAYDRGSNAIVDRYYFEMEPYPDDDTVDNVDFYGESLKEIKYQLDEYDKDRSRFGRDY